MQILYVAPLQSGSMAAQRYQIFKGMGHEVIAVDNSIGEPYSRLKKVIFRITRRINFPLDLDGINSKITEICNVTKVDLIWIDKGMNIYPGTLKLIKKQMHYAPIVNFNPDNPFIPQKGWRWFKQCMPYYDIFFVPREVSVTDHLRAGARLVKRFYWGYTPELHRPLAVSESDRVKFGEAVGFIGSYEKNRAETMQSVAQRGVPVRVWGDGWKWRKKRLSDLIIEGRTAWGPDFVKAINSFDINLCFLNKQNHDTLNTRCLAIPACRAFMLAERTNDLKELFEEGKEAEFFETPQELFDKIIFYLKHENLRKSIAQAGRERCEKSGYSNYERLQGLLTIVRKEFGLT